MCCIDGSTIRSLDLRILLSGFWVRWYLSKCMIVFGEGDILRAEHSSVYGRLFHEMVEWRRYSQ